jgi:hypothetical protein
MGGLLRASPALFFLLAGCATRSSQTADPADPPTPPAPYVRVTTSPSNELALQVAVRQFVPQHGRGPVVWLTGVSHLGDSNYYAGLQRLLDAQTVVFFEGISDQPSSDPHERGAARPRPAQETERSSLQASLAASMGLVFQLEAIDYARPQFRNSDLTISELREILKTYQPAPGEASAGERFEGVLQLMQGSSFLDSLLQAGLRFLSISPKLRALGRLMLIDVIGDLQGDLERLPNLPPDMKQLLEVLLQRRNEKVIAELKSSLKTMQPKDTVAIFYGVGHMPDLELRLRRDLNYRPGPQLWLTAFEVNPAQAGVTTAEQEMLRKLVQQQFGPLRSR